MRDTDHQHVAEALDLDADVPVPLDEQAAEDVQLWLAENIGE